MWGDLSGITLHANSLEEVTGHGWHGFDVALKGAEGDDFCVDGFKEGESLFRGRRFDGLTYPINVVLSCRIFGKDVRREEMFQEVRYRIDNVAGRMIFVQLFRS